GDRTAGTGPAHRHRARGGRRAARRRGRCRPADAGGVQRPGRRGVGHRRPDRAGPRHRRDRAATTGRLHPDGLHRGLRAGRPAAHRPLAAAGPGPRLDAHGGHPPGSARGGLLRARGGDRRLDAHGRPEDRRAGRRRGGAHRVRPDGRPRAAAGAGPPGARHSTDPREGLHGDGRREDPILRGRGVGAGLAPLAARAQI
ncbi:MAG: hypothetical protein AVDCRST_MAG41-527, partial [uncultured Corynebacteriales bacterium]